MEPDAGGSLKVRSELDIDGIGDTAKGPKTCTHPDIPPSVYLDRAKVTMLRVIPLSAQFGFTRHGDNTCSRPPSTVRDRTCSVPTHSGTHATSTLVVHLSPSTR